MSRYRFVKVEDFFQTYRSWACIVGLKSWQLNIDNRTIDLILLSSDGQEKADDSNLSGRTLCVSGSIPTKSPRMNLRMPIRGPS
jgi:hypothetical protein